VCVFLSVLYLFVHVCVFVYLCVCTVWGHHMATFVEVLVWGAGVESSAELVRCMDEREDWKVRWRTRLRQPNE